MCLFVRWVCSGKTCSLVFEPIIADIQMEWLEAWQEGRRYKVEWVRLRGYGRLLMASGLRLLISLGRQVVQIWKATSGASQLDIRSESYDDTGDPKRPPIHQIDPRLHVVHCNA